MHWFVRSWFECRNYLDFKISFAQVQSKKIALQKNYPLKKISYKNSKNLQYFVVLEHAVLFKLTEKEMELAAVELAATRAKNILIKGGRYFGILI